MLRKQFSAVAGVRGVSAAAMLVSGQRFASTRLYTKTHEWVDYDEGAKTAVVGLTEYAVKELKDITYIDLPAPGTKYEEGDDICSIESVKAVVALKSPCVGTLDTANAEFDDSAQLIRFKDGNAEKAENWIAKLKDCSLTAEGKAALMNKQQFDAFCDSEAH
jgi:glycine cleavage system H protein